MKVELDAEAIETIKEILKRDKDVIIYRCKGGYIISEQSRKTAYRYTTQETE